jgi:transposase-like protein
VSHICAGLDKVVTAFRTRRLDPTSFQYVYLDATYLNVRNEARCRRGVLPGAYAYRHGLD